MYNKIRKNIDSAGTKLNNSVAFLEQPWIKNAVFTIIVIFSLGLILVLNWHHPLFGDDWNYSLSIDGHTRIRNFSDIFYSLYNHYFEWGGRIIVHFIAEAILIFEPHKGDIVNSFAYIALTLIIYKIANLANNTRPSLLLGINFLIWFFQPAFGSTILWITGSANYLWGTLIILFFMIPYLYQAYIPKENDSLTKSILMLIGGVIAGWTNENMVVALIFMLVSIVFYFRIKQDKIPVWAISGIIGAVIGATIMIAAPGNYARMGSEIANRYNEQSYINLFISRFIDTLTTYYFHVLAPTFVYILTLCIYKTYRTENDRPILFISIIFFLGAIVATLVMTASPVFPGRATFGIITLVIVAIGILYANLDFSKVLICRMSYTVLIFAFLFFIADYNRAYKMLRSIDKQLNSRIERIEKEKKNGQKDLIFEDRITNYDSRFLHYYELTPDSADWHNRMFSKYYEISTIIIR